MEQFFIFIFFVRQKKKKLIIATITLTSIAWKKKNVRVVLQFQSGQKRSFKLIPSRGLRIFEEGCSCIFKLAPFASVFYYYFFFFLFVFSRDLKWSR